MKKIILIVTAVLLLVFSVFIITRQVSTQEMSTSSEDLRSLEIAYLQTAVSPALIEYASIEIAGLENIATSSDEYGAYLNLRVFGGQNLKNNGVRSEISIDYPYKEKDTIRYTWQFKIPDTFPYDRPQNRWWIFADWHDQPDRNKGEIDWGDHPARSAPIIFGYGNLDGRDVLGFSYGLTSQPIGTIPFERGMWNTVSITVTWSQGTDGKADVYFNNSTQPVYSVTGPNMHNGFQHYLKLGQYRDRDIATDNTVSIKNVTIEHL